MNDNNDYYWNEEPSISWNAVTSHQHNLKMRVLKLMAELEPLLEELDVTYEEIKGNG